MPYIKLPKVAGRQRNRPLKDYAGMQFGRLTALGLVERDESSQNNHVWRFSCSCGNEKDIRIKLVTTGHSSSCGCLFREMMSERNKTHGMSRSGVYRSWKDMRSRCRNKNDSDYADYGGRGIDICPEWDDFLVFYKDMGERPTRKTLDRIDVNGNYEPSNCRWADADLQANNKRNNRLITIGEETKTLQQWSNEFGVDQSKAKYRLNVGYSAEQSFQQGDLRRAKKS